MAVELRLAFQRDFSELLKMALERRYVRMVKAALDCWRDLEAADPDPDPDPGPGPDGAGDGDDATPLIPESLQRQEQKMLESSLEVHFAVALWLGR